MDIKPDGTDALFAGDTMMVSPARSSANTLVPDHPCTLRPVTIKQLYGGFLEDIERYPILIEGEPVSSVIGKPGMNEYFLQIKAFKISLVKYRPIVNYNDTTHHYLYAIYTTLDIRKTNAHKAKEKPVPSASTVFPQGACITPSVVPAEMSTKDKIFSILRDPAYRDIAHGVSLKLLRSALDINQYEIMKVITEHIYLGMIYTTVDDNHFKSSI
ncbi:replication protein A 32 kDa subunit B-like isoform X2 [Hordeum vulgare subsp. vulgare]|uniref:replication protein A 32 kDa subunit B-like isoform X2 n=1 Tax=Hordeum vulgare subsp. vulgare TaxID=112509 RepID=UPI001D1A4E11|nr:replication protein A 32 kDa subunit B-like isoform X2 [Hordeum vulgare subsp. vulgare]